MKKFSVLAVALCSIIGFSCGSNTETNNPSDSITPTEEEVVVEEKGEAQQILLESNDQMKYNQSELRVKEGMDVELTLRHTGKLPLVSMGHNFVLLQQGVDVAEFGKVTAQAEAPYYEIPEDRMKDVIAKTEMIGGGEETTVRFPCPPKGTYDFMCSFPGHAGVMNGKFIVE